MKKQHGESAPENNTRAKVSVGRIIGKSALAFSVTLGIGLVPAAAVTAGAVAVARPEHTKELLYALKGDLTPAEQAIRDAGEKAMGVDVPVRCAPIPQTQEGVHINGYTHMKDGPLPAAIRMEDQACDGFMRVVSRQEPFSEDEVKAVAASVGSATHEYVHARWNTSDESLTDCYAFQNSYYMTIAAGAAPEVADQIAGTIAVERPKVAPAEYKTSPECRADGAQDLGYDIAYFPIVS